MMRRGFSPIDPICIIDPWPDDGVTGDHLAQILTEDRPMTKPDLSADIAAFLARGGAIQTVAAGEMTGAVQAAYAAARSKESGRREIPATEQVIDYGYALFNGLGEAIALNPKTR